MIESSFSLSHKGSDFYLAALQNFYSYPGIQLLVSTTGEDLVSFTVENSTDVLHRGNATSQLPATVHITENYLVWEGGNFSERNKGLHVYSDDGSDLSVIIRNNYYLYGAEYLIYPCHDFPIQQNTYYVVSVDDNRWWEKGQVLLTGCEDNTIVTVIPTADITLPMDPQNPSSENIVLSAGNAHTFLLHRLQTLAFGRSTLGDFLPAGDLTGTQITSDKPLTVITGHECASIQDCCCEPIAGQILPSATWGKDYILVPYGGRLADTYFKVVASEVDTNVTVACNHSTPQYFSLQPGEQAEFTIGYTQYCSLVSNEQVLVAQFAPGGDVDGFGEVAMSILPSVEQYLNKITSTPIINSNETTIIFSGHYVNIFVANNDTVYFDEEPLSGWQPVYDSNGQIFGYGVQKSVTGNTVHVLRHSDVDMGVGAITYGFGWYTGYSYTSGNEMNQVHDNDRYKTGYAACNDNNLHYQLTNNNYTTPRYFVAEIIFEERFSLFIPCHGIIVLGQQCKL